MLSSRHCWSSWQGKRYARGPAMSFALTICSSSDSCASEWRCIRCSDKNHTCLDTRPFVPLMISAQELIDS